MRRAATAANRGGMRRAWEPFVRFSESEHADLFARQRETTGNLRSVWRNNLYIVQIYARAGAGGEALQLAVRRCDEAEIHGWDDLQRVKNELVGGDRVAIEIYPLESEVMDQANMRHLFVLPYGMPAPFSIHGRWA